MQHTAHPTLPRLHDHCPRVVFRIPCVDYQRLSRLSRNCHLGGENFALPGARRVVVVIVEAAFADCDGAGGDVLPDHRNIAVVVEPDRIVGMHAGGVPHEPAVFPCDIPRRASGAEDIPGAAAGADADDRLGSALPRPLYYVAAVAVERRVCEVRVAVDEWRATDVCFGHFL